MQAPSRAFVAVLDLSFPTVPKEKCELTADRQAIMPILPLRASPVHRRWYHGSDRLQLRERTDQQQLGSPETKAAWARRPTGNGPAATMAAQPRWAHVAYMEGLLSVALTQGGLLWSRPEPAPAVLNSPHRAPLRCRHHRKLPICTTALTHGRPCLPQASGWEPALPAGVTCRHRGAHSRVTKMPGRLLAGPTVLFHAAIPFRSASWSCHLRCKHVVSCTLPAVSGVWYSSWLEQAPSLPASQTLECHQGQENGYFRPKISKLG